ncbi:MAG: glycosyltransferase [Candidatus Magasanikbacteria bacterium]|nr:glycosyltransferase [Candidatus Magasanikbacteria bacterium]
MKIGQIVSTYPPYYGGMGNVVFQTASELARQGHEVEVLTPQYKEPIKKEVEFARRLRPSLRYGNAARLGNIAKHLDEFDLVHLHYPFFGTANIVRRWKKKTNKPLVLTYHMDTRAPGWKGLIFKMYAKFWMPKILEVADKIIVSSFDYANACDASEIYKENKEKWTELPFGIDTNRFQARNKPEALLKRYGLNPDIPTILFVGAMDRAHYFKGIPDLLKALTITKQKDFNFQCIFIGDGELKNNYEMKARGLGLSKEVRFIGFVTDEELPYHYNLADLFVLPSTSANEAFGMVLLEAMASSVPVIASDLPGVRQVAQDGGITVPYKKPLLLSDEIIIFLNYSVQEMKEFKRNVRIITEKKYAWPQIAINLEKIYNSLLTKY